MPVSSFAPDVLCRFAAGVALGLFAASAVPAEVGRSEAEPAERAEGYDCIIAPNRVVSLGSAAVGVLENVAVDRSDRVRQGQVLAVLESGVEATSVELARLRAGTDTEVRARRATYAFQRSNKSRADRLHSTQAMAAQAREEITHDAEVSALRLRQAEEDNTLAVLELERAERSLARRTIRSPFDGVVVAVNMAPGERVEDQPVIELAEIDPLRIEVVLPVEQYGQVRPGMLARVMPEYGPGGELEARVDAIDQVLDAASGTFGVRLSLPNPDHTLPGGLRCALHFVAGTGEQTAPASGSERPADVDPRPPSPVAARVDVDRSRESQAAPRAPAASMTAAAPTANTARTAEVVRKPPAAPSAERPSTRVATRPTIPKAAEPPPAPPAASSPPLAIATGVTSPTVRKTTRPAPPAARRPAAPAAANTTVAKRSVTGMCRAFGPLSNEKQAERFHRALTSRSIEARLSKRTVKVPRGHLVVVPAAKVEGGAAAAVARLQRGGIHDVQVLHSREEGIAVGFYTDRAIAVSQMTLVKGLGLPVQMSTLTRKAQQYFIELDRWAASGETALREAVAAAGVDSPPTAACTGLVTARR